MARVLLWPKRFNRTPLARSVHTESFSQAGLLAGSEMLEELLFGRGLLNNLAPIGIFLMRGTRGTGPLQRIGPADLLLAIPAVYGVPLGPRGAEMGSMQRLPGNLPGMPRT
jgi:hypothetical protein